MPRSIYFCSLVVLVLAAVPVKPAVAEDGPKGYACSFKVGSARSFEKGRFKPEKASKVDFDIEAVAADQQTATARRGAAASALRVVRAVNGLHFLEAVAEGYLNVTTVYERAPKLVFHPAVHSRHFAVLGQPIVAQYYGQCTPKP